MLVCLMANYKAAIYNQCWLVRSYRRNDIRRRQAIERLGLTVREAFTHSDDFEGLLAALVDGLSEKNNTPF